MNTRDTDLPPANFVFSNELTAIFDPITEKDLHKDYHEGCTDCDAKSHKNGCSVVKKWWEANKHTQDEPENKVVFECNNKCICYKKNGPLCKNRISKLNRAKLDLIVFKTLNTGYGLAAGCDIPEGTIISEYTGRLEYLTSKNTSSKANNTYSFEMDHMYVNTETTSNRKKYMINALDRGNETRFANHSCEPNMMSVISFGGVKNQNFHKIFFAALRDIKYGEELTIRYHNSAEEDQMEFVSCTCGEINCLKRLPSMIGKHWKL
uniref:SET domain-containing protein n=1 Tax=Rhabditophanes sp. KR3021 TaxID=114890 RepID=A0AC35UHQ3_9BILA